MKIGVLTSSRADFGIYSSLLRTLASDSYFNIEIIAFGTHLSDKHGYTINEIKEYSFEKILEVETLVLDGGPAEIAKAYSDTTSKFSTFWSTANYDLVLCLGDRFEMSAAVQASIPFGVRLAHFHGGEKTLGAIDNIYRHQITLASSYHFTAADEFSERVKSLIDNGSKNVFSVGSLSLSTLSQVSIIDKNEFLKKYKIPKEKFILCTFHPETFNHSKNWEFAKEMTTSFSEINEEAHLLVSMPNADTNGDIYRKALREYARISPNQITLIESFGKNDYFAAMQHSLFLLGNSSSGIIEAATFGKYAINVGLRQKGRLQSGNIIDVPFKSSSIADSANELINNPRNFSGKNKYVKDNTVGKVVEFLRAVGNGEL